MIEATSSTNRLLLPREENHILPGRLPSAYSRDSWRSTTALTGGTHRSALRALAGHGARRVDSPGVAPPRGGCVDRGPRAPAAPLPRAQGGARVGAGWWG